MKTNVGFRQMLLLCLLLCTSPLHAAETEFPFGLLLVGPNNDHGWSQAHYEAGLTIEKTVPGTKMLYIDQVNPVIRPGVTIPMLVADLASKGAKLIIANSDDMKDGILEASMLHPDILFIHATGDDALTGKAGSNLSNLMGRMIYGKMMAGYVAAMTSKTGKIGYLGPLINSETRRLAAAAFLGARYAWTQVLHKPAEELQFKVSWIGFWFNIPGVTSDPSLVAASFFDSGYDVVLSGIDTTEALVVAGQKRQEGREVWAIPYDYKGACAVNTEVCLGVPFFNWVPGYTRMIKEAMAGTWHQQFLWLEPDWQNINDENTSPIGFMNGTVMSAQVRDSLAQFQNDLGTGKINLFSGPLTYQDNSPFLAAGEKASDEQIWNLPQLLAGMEGASK